MNPLFICEIGINHHGNFNKAVRMIDRAKESGASIAKFQYYDAQKVLGLDCPDFDYANSCFFTKEQHEKLKAHCDKVGIEYLVSVFDVKDVAWADTLCKRHKVASRMNRNLEFLCYIDRCKKPTIMSIQNDVTLRRYYRDRFYFMWCITNYPSTKDEVLAHNFGYKYGLSSHCPDYIASVEAYKRNARIFENHVCESKSEVGCDIAASITFEDYSKMIYEINSQALARV